MIYISTTLEALRTLAQSNTESLININDRDAFYNSWTWRKKRNEIAQRDNQECQVCKDDGKVTLATSTHPLIVHHIKPLEYHPDLKLDDNNLTTVCIACHNSIHTSAAHKVWDDEWW